MVYMYKMQTFNYFSLRDAIRSLTLIFPRLMNPELIFQRSLEYFQPLGVLVFHHWLHYLRHQALKIITDILITEKCSCRLLLIKS